MRDKSSKLDSPLQLLFQILRLLKQFPLSFLVLADFVGATEIDAVPVSEMSVWLSQIPGTFQSHRSLHTCVTKP